MQRKSFLTTTISSVILGECIRRYMMRPYDTKWINYNNQLQGSNFIVINGLRIHYQTHEFGNASSIIFLHGFCSSSQTWATCLPSFAKAGYNPIALDLKGFGFSEKPPDGRYHIQDQAQLIVSFLDKLNINQTILCGNSYGGAVALACATMWPDRFKKLILIDAVYNDKPTSQFPFNFCNWLAKLFFIKNLSTATILGSRKALELGLKLMFYKKSLVTNEKIDSYYRHLRTSSCQEAILASIKQWELDWLISELNHIEIPTLILWGEQDKLIPVEVGAMLHLGIPKSEFIVIPECGHLPQEEYPLDVVKFITNFISPTQHLL